MSFERFGSSDIYIYQHVGGFIECCGCSLEAPLGLTIEEDGPLFGFAKLNTPREALAHLDAHEAAGDDIGGARRRIEKEYEDLDAPIKPFVRSEEEEKRQRERLAKFFPPKEFRDRSNGE